MLVAMQVRPTPRSVQSVEYQSRSVREGGNGRFRTGTDRHSTLLSTRNLDVSNKDIEQWTGNGSGLSSQFDSFTGVDAQSRWTVRNPQDGEMEAQFFIGSRSRSSTQGVIQSRSLRAQGALNLESETGMETRGRLTRIESDQRSAFGTQVKTHLGSSAEAQVEAEVSTTRGTGVRAGLKGEVGVAAGVDVGLDFDRNHKQGVTKLSLHGGATALLGLEFSGEVTLHDADIREFGGNLARGIQQLTRMQLQATRALTDSIVSIVT